MKTSKDRLDAYRAKAKSNVGVRAEIRLNLPNAAESYVTHNAPLDWREIAKRAKAFSKSALCGAPFYINTTRERGRWVESPEDLGLRLVGFADEVAPRRVTHKGWFIDDEIQDEVARGVVYALPAKAGCARFVYGVADPHNDGPAIIALDVVTAEPGDADRAQSDAATWADSMAESYAMGEKEHNAAWRAGRDWADTGQIVATTRKRLASISREIRTHTTVNAPALCQALRERVRQLFNEYHSALEKRDQLVSGGGYGWTQTQQLAFNDGAERTVFQHA